MTTRLLQSRESRSAFERSRLEGDGPRRPLGSRHAYCRPFPLIRVIGSRCAHEAPRLRREGGCSALTGGIGVWSLRLAPPQPLRGGLLDRGESLPPRPAWAGGGAWRRGEPGAETPARSPAVRVQSPLCAASRLVEPPLASRPFRR